MYVKANILIRQAEVTAQRTMIEPAQNRFGIEPDIPLLDKPASRDGTFDHGGGCNMARAVATTEAYITSRRQREKVEMLFAQLGRILKLDRLHLRGPNGAKEQFLLAATANNLRELAKIIPMPA